MSITDEQLELILLALHLVEKGNKEGLVENGIVLSRKELFSYWREKIDSCPVFEGFAKRILGKYKADKRFQKTLENKQQNDESVAALTQFPIKPGFPNSVCWIMTCHNETDFVRQAVASIRQNDGGSILVINDGGAFLEELIEICEENEATLIDSERFKTPDNGACWWRRFFTEGLKTSADFLIKFDPDAFMHRPLTQSISGLNYFGTTKDFPERNLFTVQGGVQGFSREFAERILSTGILDVFDGEGLRQDGSFSTDIFIGLVAEALYQFGEEWREVWSVWGERPSLPENDFLKFAITHPHPVFSGEAEGISAGHVARIDICRSCESFRRSDNVCLVSDSYIYPKTKNPTEACPAGKW